VDHLSADTIRAFLAHLEKNRRCIVSTRNQRLAAIHALVRFIGERSPEHLQWCSQIRTVLFKRTGKSPIPYLEKETELCPLEYWIYPPDGVDLTERAMLQPERDDVLDGVEDPFP
jgi:hypothetical protein